MEELTKAIRILQYQSSKITDSLEETACSALSLGMDRLAERSQKQAVMLREAVENITIASHKASDESFRRAQQGSANILRTAMAVGALCNSTKS